MGLLADIFSYGDTQKRRLRGLLDDPAGTLGLGATRAVEDQAGLLGLMDQAGVTPGSNSVLLDNKKRAAQQLADKALESFGGLLGVTIGKPVKVFHGTKSSFSPESYDMQRAGSASMHESAQAPVMWTTRSPKVAETFVNDLVFDKTPLDRYGPRGAGLRAVGMGRDWKDGANVMPMKATLKNPYVINGAEAEKKIFGVGDFRGGGDEFAKVIQAAKDAGHDGVIIKANPRGALEFRAEQYLMFDPKMQAKSVFDR